MVVAILNGLLGLMEIIGFGLVQPEFVLESTALKTGREWDRLIGFCISFVHFLHDGAILSALCFVVLFCRDGEFNCYRNSNPIRIRIFKESESKSEF